jgi:hypothetical protein
MPMTDKVAATNKSLKAVSVMLRGFLIILPCVLVKYSFLILSILHHKHGARHSSFEIQWTTASGIHNQH